MKSKNLRAIQRLEILVDKAVTENWSMDKLAGLLSKPKKVNDYATADSFTKPNNKVELGTPIIQKLILPSSKSGISR